MFIFIEDVSFRKEGGEGGGGYMKVSEPAV